MASSTSAASPMNYSFVRLSSSEFETISTYIRTHVGIELGPVKKALVESRLQKRLRVLGITTFKEYLALVLTKNADPVEHVQFIDSITTNKTDFFRESAHFDYITEIITQKAIQGKPYRKLRVWSAACSSGEEVYTLAMVLESLKAKNYLGDYEILGTDISQKVLKMAVSAEFDQQKLAPVPVEMKRKYVLRHKDKTIKKCKISKVLRSKVSFKPLNFLSSVWPDIGSFDFIFCRNVYIYFHQETQKKVTERMMTYLNSDGYLFLGHSESLNGYGLPLVQVHPSVYKHAY